MRFKVLCATAAFVWAASSPVWANQLVLEGSDATALHHDSAYTGQLFTFMQNGSSLPVLILGGSTLSGLAAGQAVLAPSYSLSGFSLSNFSAVYIESPGRCCTQAMDPISGNSISPADVAAIGAAEALGLNVTIQNYGGGPQWGAILPAGVNALDASNFGGITGFGTAGGPGCTDGEVFNANGLSKGFTQPGVLSCYEHQAYRTSAFTPLGFISLVDADPAFFGADGSALLALGGPLGTPAPSAVPEPGIFSSSDLASSGWVASVGAVASARNRLRRHAVLVSRAPRLASAPVVFFTSLDASRGHLHGATAVTLLDLRQQFASRGGWSKAS